MIENIPTEEQSIFKTKFQALQLLWWEDYDTNIRRVAEEYNQGVFWFKKHLSPLSHHFAAFIWWWDDSSFGDLTHPSDIQTLVRDIEKNFYRLSNAWGSNVWKWWEYRVALDELHSVKISDTASTLFITKNKVDNLTWWEYLLFPEMFHNNDMAELKTHKQVKKQILKSIAKLV